jgi:N-acetylglutamate synthase-like GNAT family acetyltransferase
MPPQPRLYHSHRVERVAACAPPELFRELGNIHVNLIREGVLEALGPEFVATVYRELSRGKGLLIYAAFREATLVGFLAASTNLMCSLRAMGAVGALRIGARAFLQLWRPRLFKQMLQSAGYFFHRSKAGAVPASTAASSAGDRAELLAIAVAPEMQGHGVGKSLVSAFEDDLRKAGHVRRYFVSTNSAEVGSNAFYQAVGFTLIGQKPHHDLVLNVYMKDFVAALE